MRSRQSLRGEDSLAESPPCRRRAPHQHCSQRNAQCRGAAPVPHPPSAPADVSSCTMSPNRISMGSTTSSSRLAKAIQER